MTNQRVPAARGRSREQCPRRGQPEERREVARAEDARRQGAVIAECPEARPARSKAHGVAGRGRRRVRGARGGADRRVRARGRPAGHARGADRARRLAARARRADRGRGVRAAPRREGRGRTRADPRRQRPPLGRDRAPLPRRRAGRAHARAAHPQGAPGRAAATGRACGRARPWVGGVRTQAATRASVSPRSQPIEPERRDACQLVSERGMPDEPESGRTVGQPAACWTPDEPDPCEDPGDFRGDNAANEPRQRRLAASSIPLATPATASGRQESLASRPGARARTAGS